MLILYKFYYDTQYDQYHAIKKLGVGQLWKLILSLFWQVVLVERLALRALRASSFS